MLKNSLKPDVNTMQIKFLFERVYLTYVLKTDLQLKKVIELDFYAPLELL